MSRIHMHSHSAIPHPHVTHFPGHTFCVSSPGYEFPVTLWVCIFTLQPQTGGCHKSYCLSFSVCNK